MAVTVITPLYPGVRQTPYSAYFVCAGDDATAPGTLGRTAVLAGCPEGPLKTLLTRTADWTVFNLGNANCGLIHCRVSTLGSNGLISTSARFLWTATGLKAAVAPVSGALLVEIRLSQTERL